VNSQITAAVQPGESGTPLDAALLSQGAAWGKSLSAAGAAAESGPEAATVAGDIDLAALHLDNAVLAADLAKEAAVSSQWAMADVALAKAAKDCAG
jgi:hypothetical protein